MTGARYQIRQLSRSDLEVFRPVRLEALRLHPEAFGSDHDEEAQVAPDALAQRLLEPPSTMFGGFCKATLVGTAGLLRHSRVKSRHRGVLFAMYVDAAHRGSGLAGRLVAAVIGRARDDGVSMLTLTVTIGNAGAQRLYERFGFRTYGVEPRALRIGDTFHDDALMALRLD
jgi:RimJ/RimL family protein N-acetyltransferase